MELPIPLDCPECGDCDPVTTLVPGPTGAAGSNGTNGADGVNAYTTLTAGFVMPAVSSTVVATVAVTSWMVIGQVLYVQTAGYMKVTAIGGATSVTLENLGYSGNAAPTTAINSGNKVGPGGLIGATGANPSGALIDTNNLNDVDDVALSRDNLGLGDLAVLDTVNNGNWSGTDLAVANGGTGGSDAATARTNLELVKGVLNTNIPIIDTTFTDGDAVFATATGLKTKTDAEAITALGLSKTVSGIAGIQQDKVDNTTPGGLTSGSWVTRVLNSMGLNDGGVSSHNAGTGEITLAAGTYRLYAGALGYKVDRHCIRIWNVTDAAQINQAGFPAHAPAAADIQTMSELFIRFTLAGTKVIRMEQRCETTNATDGLGKAQNFGLSNNIYAYVYIFKEAG